MLRTATMGLLSAVAVKAAPEAAPKEKDPKKKNDEDCSLVCRPSELPIYGNLRKTQPKEPREHKESALEKNLETGVRAVREEVQAGYRAVADQAGIIGTYVDTAKAHTQHTLDILNEPQNSLHRSGAIVVGGLAGFIFAARGGFVKKVIYTGIGSGAVASMCYPRQAEDNCRVVLHEGRKIFAVAYNFIKGVKPGEEVPIEPIQKFPTSLQDLKFLALDLIDEAKEVVLPKKK
ncbi:MICOS complex subunit MIC27 [Drosophila pseudoobscura]|uniref:MICOS complex subunit n=1 Tax=Drosophila pseudoobscura pseudoobscura TaxID=46245 RepID=A0A6I8URF4_DROPS|nr:MICOS complex subunit MIC27 [Drosophila pseudoobscura]